VRSVGWDAHFFFVRRVLVALNAVHLGMGLCGRPLSLGSSHPALEESSSELALSSSHFGSNMPSRAARRCSR
jgi:hypothetical protein